MNPKKCVYFASAVYTEDTYVGITLAFFDTRKRLHRSSDISPKRKTMDRCHATMLRRGFYYFMFSPLCELTADDATRLLFRRMEVRGMLLLRSRMNTQGQSLRGNQKGFVID